MITKNIKFSISFIENVYNFHYPSEVPQINSILKIPFIISSILIGFLFPYLIKSL
jgi:hypothetical protein